MPDRGSTVLVVDDDESLRLAVEAMLLRSGYSPITASCGAEALDKSRDFQGAIDLLLTDVRMPDMDGFALAEQIAAERPRIRILMMSGDLAGWNSAAPLLRKPFRLTELVDEVARVLNDSSSSSLGAFPEEIFSGDDVQASFGRELELARNRYLEACHEWLQVAKDVPSAIPSPDGTTRLDMRARSRKEAFAEYQRAWSRFQEYVVQKKIRSRY